MKSTTTWKQSPKEACGLQKREGTNEEQGPDLREEVRSWGLVARVGGAAGGATGGAAGIGGGATGGAASVCSGAAGGAARRATSGATGVGSPPCVRRTAGGATRGTPGGAARIGRWFGFGFGGG